ncbi:MAG TPA: tetratricopeptide repeat protein [Methylomirabilota bacterium]|nr:tetratricopeptide repeat protein [Methylomirabilota bacterium]
MKSLVEKLLLIALMASALAVPQARSQPEEAPAAPSPASATNDTDLLLKNFLLLQDQLRTTQRAMEQGREQAQTDARRTEELMAARLNLIEQTLNARRTEEITSLQQSTRTVIIIASIITVAGLLAVVFAGLVQVRAMTRLSEVSQQLRTALPVPQLEAGGNALLLNHSSVEKFNANLLGALDRLQKRLEEIEAAASSTQTTTNGHKQVAAPAPINPQMTTILGKGQALLNLDKAEEALDQFDEALRLEPRNIEAWIKRGTALERLQRVDEAIVAYDQAIAVDASTATAYLFKAGVYNRQKKYAEALQCYEKALSAQQKSRTQTARA